MKLRRDAIGNSLKDGCLSWRRMLEVREALEKAFDYRGNITVTREGRDDVLQGYLCSTGGSGNDTAQTRMVRDYALRTDMTKVEHRI